MMQNRAVKTFSTVNFGKSCSMKTEAQANIAAWRPNIENCENPMPKPASKCEPNEAS